jgi:hypothetical protein
MNALGLENPRSFAARAIRISRSASIRTDRAIALCFGKSALLSGKPPGSLPVTAGVYKRSTQSRNRTHHNWRAGHDLQQEKTPHTLRPFMFHYLSVLAIIVADAFVDLKQPVGKMKFSETRAA